MMELEGTTDDYARLSLKDLLEARDLYHFHLLNKVNVVGTAVGRYLIRKPGVAHDDARTFANAEVRDFSWPCVLVLVSDWVARAQFRSGKGNTSPYELVPKSLFMPDGRKVPVCTVKVEPAGAPASTVPTVPSWVWPPSYLGPGFPVVTEVQGQDRHA